MMHRNLDKLVKLVDEILDFRKIGMDDTTPTGNESASALPSTEEQNHGEEACEEPGEKPEILVVDDNADVRTLLKTILQEQYHVTLADNGETGLKEAQRLVPDLIVSDVMMPVMDGLEMCRKIKSDIITCHIPVLMLTARTPGELPNGSGAG